jgi:hypothetical protein
MVKTNNIHKIASIVLGVCVLISIVVFAIFYYGMLTEPDLNETSGLDLLLSWMYILIGVNLLALLSSIVWTFLKNR